MLGSWVEQLGSIEKAITEAKQLDASAEVLAAIEEEKANVEAILAKARDCPETWPDGQGGAGLFCDGDGHIKRF